MATVLATSPKATRPAGALRVNGLHHLALLTGDMDATVHFYTEVLDLPLVLTDAPPAGALDRHYFFDVGAGGTLAFFSRKGAPPPAELKAGSTIGSMHHVALTLDRMEDLGRLKQRLTDHGLVFREVDHGYCQSVYVKDPVNDIQLEFSVWTVEASPEHPHQQDPHPTPAARRLLGQA
ncbi:MAG TPA: VOC family protein [Chloroflexota bacterium]|nr:VOC family protein [Chloroflexota bacterium]